MFYFIKFFTDFKKGESHQFELYVFLSYIFMDMYIFFISSGSLIKLVLIKFLNN